MKVLINGFEEPKPLRVEPGHTIGNLKDYFIANYPGHTVSITFGNGETLDPVVWESNLYDNNDFSHYRDFLRRSTINLTEPTPTPTVTYKVNLYETNGVVMCHGHKHPPPSIPLWLADQKINWVFVDIDPETEPDLVVDYRKKKSLYRLGYDQWDYILENHCPIHGRLTDVELFLTAVSPLLKIGGQVLYGAIFNHAFDVNNKSTYTVAEYESRKESYLRGEMEHINQNISRVADKTGYSYETKIRTGTFDRDQFVIFTKINLYDI